jgi:hypothetical protein
MRGELEVEQTRPGILRGATLLNQHGAEHRPTATPLYPVVQRHLETFLIQAAEADPMGNGVS